MYQFQGDTDNIVFLSLGKKVMEVGKRYTVTVEEEDSDYNEVTRTLTGEYRGLSNQVDYVLFWEDGESSARDIHLSDITNLKPAD